MNETLGFTDVLRKSFTSIDFSSTLTLIDILLILLITFFMGLFIFYIYKRTFRGVLYTESYNISLVAVALVTALVIMTISSNIILSLGMVGALSIVRFRTAIKDSMDIVFMFWAIAIGIANGAGYFKISVTGSVVIALALFFLSKYKSSKSPYLLIIDTESSDAEMVKSSVAKLFSDLNLKSESTSNGLTELTIEIRMNQEDKIKISERLQSIPQIHKSALLSYNGDYIS